MGPLPILCDRYLQHPLSLIQSQLQTLRVNEHLMVNNLIQIYLRTAKTNKQANNKKSLMHIWVTSQLQNYRYLTPVFPYAHSSGSQKLRRGGVQETWNISRRVWQPSFFGLFFTGRGGGGMAPLPRPPPRIRYWPILPNSVTLIARSVASEE